MHRRVERSGNGVMASVVFNMHCDPHALIPSVYDSTNQSFRDERCAPREAVTRTNTLAEAAFAMGD
jgi:hypothetical protein